MISPPASSSKIPTPRANAAAARASQCDRLLSPFRRTGLERGGRGDIETQHIPLHRHSRESGNPAAFLADSGPGKLDPRFRGGDEDGLMRTRIVFFGRLAEQIGREREVDIPADGCTMGALRKQLIEAP